jgi:nicotinate-nucleotide adenylyltransferase
MGSDTFLQLEKWRNYTYLLKNIRFIVYMRPGDLLQDVQEQILRFNDKFNTLVHLIEEEPFMISSTEIREHFYEFEFNHSMIPKEVNDFIIEHNLYR